MANIPELPIELWHKICGDLTDSPNSLCLLSQTNCQLQQLAGNVASKYEAHLHVTFPSEDCVHEQETSKQKVEFEMILNRKSKFRNSGKLHCHSTFFAKIDRIDDAFEDMFKVFAEELITLRLNNAPQDASFLSNFNKFNFPKIDNICFNGSVPIGNGVYELFQCCPNLERLVVSNPQEMADFSKFWPSLKNSKKLEVLDLMHFHHSSLTEFKLPRNCRQLFFCPKIDKPCKDADNLANLVYSTNWKRVYIHSAEVLDSLNSKLHKNVKGVEEFCFSSKTFAINYALKFLKKCENLKSFNWYGLHSCIAPIVISRLLTSLPKNIIFGGCVACKDNNLVGEGGYLEVANRLPQTIAVQVTHLLRRPEFREIYNKLLDDAILFETSNATVMYIQKKDAHCGPNCLDIHQISKNAGINL